MTAPLVFLDTETTGLDLDDDIWEFAAIRREPDGTETELHLFIAHDENKCKRLPEPFCSDHMERFPSHDQETGRVAAGNRIFDFFVGKPELGSGHKPHVVGAVPNFDTERLARLISNTGSVIPWHYHLIDVETLAVGYLAREGISVALPWDSDALSQAVGVDADRFERHTAMGDARWARAIYDAVTGGAP